MANNPPDERARRRTPRRQGGSDQRQRGGGERGRRSGQGSRLSREELEWARDLWTHQEPAEEIADQLGVELAQIEALIATWSRDQG